MGSEWPSPSSASRRRGGDAGGLFERVKRSSLNLDRAEDAAAIMHWQEEVTELGFFHKGWMPSCHMLYAEVRPSFPKVFLVALAGIQGIVYCGGIVHEQNKKKLKRLCFPTSLSSSKIDIIRVCRLGVTKNVWVKTRRVFRHKERYWEKKISSDSQGLGVSTTHRADVRVPNTSRAKRVVNRAHIFYLMDSMVNRARRFRGSDSACIYSIRICPCLHRYVILHSLLRLALVRGCVARFNFSP